jgi:PAS domain S-box-containing protein
MNALDGVVKIVKTNSDHANGTEKTPMISKQKILDANILIVDDHQSNLFLLEEMQRNAGYTCMTLTTDPYAVCELYRKNRYDLILLDLQMPGMDGFQVMKCLQEIETDDYLPVLVITAQPDHKLRALAAGAKDFISKPFDILEIQTRIHNMLEVRLLYKKLKNANKVLEQTVQERTAELQASEARFRRLTELSSDWYWEQNADGLFTRVFGPVFEMLGIRTDEGEGKELENQGMRWNESERIALNAKLSARQPFLDFVYSRIHPDGSQQYLMVSGEPMFDRSGRYIGYRGVGKDVTDPIHPEGKVSQQKG